MADEKKKLNNIRAALSDPKTRVIYLGGLAAMVLVIVFAGASFLSKKPTPRGGPASEVARAPSLQNQTPTDPHKPSTPQYDNLVAKENEQAAEKAKEQGGSAVPVVRNAPEQKAPPAAQPQPAPPAAQQQAAYRQDDKSRQDAIAAKTKAMKDQYNLLLAAWAPKEHTNLPVAQQPRAEGSATAGASAAASTAPARPAAPTQCAPVKKAGDTCYAKLESAINSDEPSPVTATIHQCGELDQSKVVGKVESPGKYAETAIVRFTAINVKGQPSSVPIDAYAINEETRRTALASAVDNHYMMRFGAMFASGFFGGIGEALLKGGQNEQIVTTQTGAVVQREAFSSKQLVLAGLGNVGKQAGSGLSGVINRPATVTVDAEIGIGILFMSDLTLKSCQ